MQYSTVLYHTLPFYTKMVELTDLHLGSFHFYSNTLSDRNEQVVDSRQRINKTHVESKPHPPPTLYCHRTSDLQITRSSFRLLSVRPIRRSHTDFGPLVLQQVDDCPLHRQAHARSLSGQARSDGPSYTAHVRLDGARALPMSHWRAPVLVLSFVETGRGEGTVERKAHACRSFLRGVARPISIDAARSHTSQGR